MHADGFRTSKSPTIDRHKGLFGGCAPESNNTSTMCPERVDSARTTRGLRKELERRSRESALAAHPIAQLLGGIEIDGIDDGAFMNWSNDTAEDLLDDPTRPLNVATMEMGPD